MLGLLQGWDPETWLGRATRFATAVCGLRGALPDDPAFYAGVPWAREVTR